MLQESEAAAKFIDALLDQKLPEGTGKDVREQLKRDMLQRLENRFNQAIIESLNSDQLTQLEHLIDTDQADKIQGFLHEQGVDLQTLTAQVMSDFKASYGA